MHTDVEKRVNSYYYFMEEAMLSQVCPNLGKIPRGEPMLPYGFNGIECSQE